MSDPFITAPVAAIQYNRDVDRIDQITGGVFREAVFVKAAPGEQVASVGFSSTFVERPCFTYGWELGAGDELKQGQFPMVSVGVRSWKFRIRNTGDRIYTGASLIIAILGQTGQHFTIHASFEGQGLWSPV